MIKFTETTTSITVQLCHGRLCGPVVIPCCEHNKHFKFLLQQVSRRSRIPKGLSFELCRRRQPDQIRAMGEIDPNQLLQVVVRAPVRAVVTSSTGRTSEIAIREHSRGLALLQSGDLPAPTAVCVSCLAWTA